MHWNWQKDDWPNFTYNTQFFRASEAEFLVLSGQMQGTLQHLSDEDQSQLRVELIAEESLLTSRIEGEDLDRDSIQSSIRREFGLQHDSGHHKPYEEGISRMMMDVYFSWEESLSNELLHRWHKNLLSETPQHEDAGAYRTHPEPIQVVSGALYRPKVHFEAPPSDSVSHEMDQFIAWFNQAHHERTPEPLTLAAITHLWFESIHPFPDGNGRVGRALVEYSLSKSLKKPAIISLSAAIEKERKAYYDALERANKHNEINHWIDYFVSTLLKAQQHSLATIEFVVKKGKFYQRYGDKFNERQKKVVARILKEGIEGFTGGLSASNYLSITQTSPATATRDLNRFVEMGAFRKTGDKKSARYWLEL